METCQAITYMCSHTLQRADPLTRVGYRVLLAGKLATDHIDKKPITIQPEADLRGERDNRSPILTL